MYSDQNITFRTSRGYEIEMRNLTYKNAITFRLKQKIFDAILMMHSPFESYLNAWNNVKNRKLVLKWNDHVTKNFIVRVDSITKNIVKTLLDLPSQDYEEVQIRIYNYLESFKPSKSI